MLGVTQDRTDIQILQDNWDGLPLSYDDVNRDSTLGRGKYGDGYFKNGFTVGVHPVSSVGRLEFMATSKGVEPVVHVGWANFFENTVRVKSAEMPIGDFFGLAEAIVSRDEQKGIDCTHRIMQYEAPDIIDQDSVKTFVGEAKRYLEYGLLESTLWDKASEGRKVCILNPSIPTLKRVLQMKGELPVYYTEMGLSGSEYYQELVKCMAIDGYKNGPVRTPLTSLDKENTYYLGFSGGKDSRKLLPHMFGFELNPYHPDSLNGMISGVTHSKNGLKIEIARGSYTRYEWYEDDPTYFRYYGDVVSPMLKDRKVGGEEAFNFVCSHEVGFFQRSDTLINEGDVLCDGYFFEDAILRQERKGEYLCYIDTSNRIVDIERSCSYENRRQLMRNAKFDLELATPIHDSRRAKLAYLRYRSSACVIAYVRPNEVPQEKWRQAIVERETIQYGVLKGRIFVRSDRAVATYVWSPKFGYRKLLEGNYPCDENEFVQLLDHSMLRAEIFPYTHEAGIQAIIREGYTPYNCVSKASGVWETLEFCRIDVDYKSNFNLVEVFKSYAKFIGTFRKKSLIVARGGIKRVESVIDKELFEFEDIATDYAVRLDGIDDLSVH